MQSRTGELRLPSGRISGNLTLNGAHLNNPNGVAVNAEHLDVGSYLRAQDGFICDCEIILTAARIGAAVHIDGARLRHRGRRVVSPHVRAGAAARRECARGDIDPARGGRHDRGLIDVDPSCRQVRSSRGVLAWIPLVIGSLASLGANVAVADPTLIARFIAAWPSLALIGAYELLMGQIRQGRSARPQAEEGVQQGRRSESTGDVGNAQPKSTHERARCLHQLAWQCAQGNCGPDGAIAAQFLAVPAGVDGSRTQGALDSLSHRLVTP
ncbi:hypothetical protein [Nonomuraea sp. NBC_00507]|uniref:hypothetical protein n=1 Tax=Nonomuraea sp. NBC_00507 TaxID=2976002 RepID=UPI003FA53287